jgi:glycosidase
MQFALQNLIDSHDTDRLGSMIVNRPIDETYLEPQRFDYDVPRRASPRHDPTYEVRRPSAQERRLQRMVALMQMTYLGAPMIYYGDEVGMWGADDPCDRCPMLWEDLGPYDLQTADPLHRPRQPDAVEVDREMLDFYREAIALRNRRAVLRQGSYSTVQCDDEAKFFVFRRELDDEQVLVVFNRSDNGHRWMLPDGTDKLDVAFATDEACKTQGNGGNRSVIVPALSAAVLAEP